MNTVCTSNAELSFTFAFLMRKYTPRTITVICMYHFYQYNWISNLYRINIFRFLMDELSNPEYGISR